MRRGEKTSEVLVVGAGVIGLACAWRAAQRGLSVRVIDRDTPGAGASRVAAGMLAPVGEASWGEEALLQLNLDSARAYPEFAAELEEASGRPVGYRRSGALHVALDVDEAEELRRHHELQASLGLAAEWLRSSECRELEPGLAPGIAGGVHAADDAAVDPRTLVGALVAAIGRAGGEIVPGADATDAVIEGERLRGVRIADGRELLADRVVLATGSWSGSAGWLPEDARPAVRPVKGEVVNLRGAAASAVSERIVATPRVYVVPRADGRVVVGATVEECGFDLTVTAGGVHELLREAYRVLPEIAELEFSEALAGLRPGTPDNAPVIGRGSLDGLVVATGHYRNGILLAPITADAVAAILAGDDPPAVVAPMTPERFEGVGAR
ncbi:MAG TPA: glycine oxidase ThiO [Solirubrobacterales bacterium]|nr:glycine oxidase ThiO [Solirubrobacterales bacterium]